MWSLLFKSICKYVKSSYVQFQVAGKIFGNNNYVVKVSL
jgi:hypothetical protein